MPVEPSAHFGLLVGGVVVENDVDGLVGGQLGFDGVEETDELLMSVALHVAADHRAIEDIERGKQRGRAIALVIVGHGRPTSALERKPRLGPVERLNLALFIDRQHDGVGRWRDIEPDDVVQFCCEGLVVGTVRISVCGRP